VLFLAVEARVNSPGLALDKPNAGDPKDDACLLCSIGELTPKGEDENPSDEVCPKTFLAPAPPNPPPNGVAVEVCAPMVDFVSEKGVVTFANFG